MVFTIAAAKSLIGAKIANIEKPDGAIHSSGKEGSFPS